MRTALTFALFLILPGAFALVATFLLIRAARRRRDARLPMGIVRFDVQGKPYAAFLWQDGSRTDVEQSERWVN
jgi:hypothetical protein